MKYDSVEIWNLVYVEIKVQGEGVQITTPLSALAKGE